MPGPKSLAELCIAVCQRHVAELSSVGNGDSLQYHHVRDILIRVTNPAQLREIELNSPHIQGETSELWQRLIKKEFPSESHEKNYAPKNPTKWYKIYERYADERRESQQQAEAELRAKFQGLQQKRDNNVSRIVDQRYLPKPPKTGRTFGLPRGRGWKELPSSLSFAAGSRMKTTTGASVMKKVRRETREIAGIRSKMAVPTGLIRAPRLNKAPPSMASEHRIAAQPSFRPTSTSSRPPVSSKTTYLSDSSDDEDEELFGDEGSSKKKGKSVSAGPMSPANNSRDGASSARNPTTPSKTTAYRDQKASKPPSSAGLKRGGIMGNAPKTNSNIRIERPKPKPEPATSISADSSRSHKIIAQHNGPQSPPPLPTSLVELQPARPVIGNAEQPKKRKAVDIFMPKKKTRR